MRTTHFILGIVNVLGPLTKILLNVAVKSGPRLKWMMSSASGSSGTVLTPSPRLPVARFGRNLLISSRIHFSGAGKFREHVFIDDAACVTQKNGLLVYFSCYSTWQSSKSKKESERQSKYYKLCAYFANVMSPLSSLAVFMALPSQQRE